MKTSQAQVVFLTLCTVACSMVLGSQLNNATHIVSPSPTVQPSSTSNHSSSPTPHSSSLHNHSSSIHHNHSSTIHHNVSSTIHHNMSSSTHSNISSIMPSPSINYTVTVNMTSMIHSASHMTYTVSPSHSISPNGTSTVMPSSSSVVPTTTPPTPKWPKGKFSVKKGNESCLLMWLSMEFTVKYKNESSGEMLSFDVIMPNSSSASGTCGNSISAIHIEWAGFYSLDAAFETVETADLSPEQYHWTTKNLTLYVKLFNNSAFVDGNKNVTEIEETTDKNLQWLSGINGNSLNCSQKETVKFGDSITANFENIRIQPFAVKKDKFSDKVDVCNAKHTTTSAPIVTTHPPKNSDNTVAIAVGCSLAGLVLIVLIGYLIGRRKKNSIRYRKL